MVCFSNSDLLKANDFCLSSELVIPVIIPVYSLDKINCRFLTYDKVFNFDQNMEYSKYKYIA